MEETPGSRALLPHLNTPRAAKTSPLRAPGPPSGPPPAARPEPLPPPALPPGADLGAAPPPARSPARPRPRLAGAAGTERREAGERHCLAALSPASTFPSSHSRERGGEGKEVGPSDSQEAPGAGGAARCRSARAPPLLPHQVSPLRRAVLSSAATSVRCVSRSAAPPSAIFSARQRQRRQEQGRAALHAGSDARGRRPRPRPSQKPRGGDRNGPGGSAPPRGWEVFRPACPVPSSPCGETGRRHFLQRRNGSAGIVRALVPRYQRSGSDRHNSYDDTVSVVVEIL